MRIYDTYFDQAGIQRQARIPESDPSLWVYVIRMKAPVRDKVMTYLKEKSGINTLVQYTSTINQLPIWLEIAAKTAEVSVSEQLSKEILSLPVHSGITHRMPSIFVKKWVRQLMNFAKEYPIV